MLTSTVLAVTAALAAGLPSCSELPAGDWKDPRFWGDYFLDKYAAERELGPLEPGPAPLVHPRTVLLITGVTIPAEWFEPMKARLVRDGFKPVVYEPPALLSGDLFENAQALAAVVEQVKADSGQDKIDILAECTGGLIARHYIQSLGGDQSVSRLVTFISPQHGLPKAPLAAAYAGWPALDDLTPGSEFLHAVNDVPLPADVRVTSIYSCTDEYIQPYTTSIIPGAKNIGMCTGFVGHFQFFYDPQLYLTMHDALVEGVDDSNPAATPPVTSPDDPATTDDAGGGCAAGGSTAGGAALLLVGAAVVATRRRRARA